MDLNYESIIIEKAKRGNEEAWAILFTWNFKLVYNFCLQLIMGRNTDAEEITQQTFIIAAKKIHRFDANKGTFRLWLFGIARNCTRKHASKKELVVYDSRNINIDTRTKTAPAYPDNILVLEALAQLPARHSSILEAKYFEKKTMAILAQEHKTSVNAIGLRLSRAREKFKQIYQTLKKQEHDI